METINRKKAPEFKKVEDINFISPKKIILKNQIPLYYIKAGDKEVVKIEFVFNAGNWYDTKPLVASITNTMLHEGTLKYNSKQIAEKLDYFGAITSFNITNDCAYLTLLTLNKFVPETLEIIEEIIKNSSFPKEEFDVLIKNKKQSFELESNKVKTIARRKFGELVYGKNHPYANVHTIEDYDKVNIADLKKFYFEHYSSLNCQILISGNVTDNEIKEIEKKFGNANWGSTINIYLSNHKINSTKEKIHFIKKEQSVQSAIRIGKELFNKTHIDYFGFSVLNTILGGYFGSRLMSNIREDKGYTYGIGSVLLSLKNSGYFIIVTEAGADVCKFATKEIYNEIDKLKTELVPENELQLVKNYMLGEMLRAFDGPFAIADSIKDMLLFEHDIQYYKDFLKKINTITSEEIRELANRYFEKDSFYEIIAGEIL